MDIFTTIYNVFKIKKQNATSFKPINQTYWTYNNPNSFNNQFKKYKFVIPPINNFNKYEKFTPLVVSNTVPVIKIPVNNEEDLDDNNNNNDNKIDSEDDKVNYENDYNFFINFLIAGGIIGTGLITYSYWTNLRLK